jgi:hypothetical protein
MQIRELPAHPGHLMLNIGSFPSATIVTVAPMQGIRGIAGGARQHPRGKAFIILVCICHSILYPTWAQNSHRNEQHRGLLHQIAQK